MARWLQSSYAEHAVHANGVPSLVLSLPIISTGDRRNQILSLTDAPSQRAASRATLAKCLKNGSSSRFRQQEIKPLLSPAASSLTNLVKEKNTAVGRVGAKSASIRPDALLLPPLFAALNLKRKDALPVSFR